MLLYWKGLNSGVTVLDRGWSYGWVRMHHSLFIVLAANNITAHYWQTASNTMFSLTNQPTDQFVCIQVTDYNYTIACLQRWPWHGLIWKCRLSPATVLSKLYSCRRLEFLSWNVFVVTIIVITIIFVSCSYCSSSSSIFMVFFNYFGCFSEAILISFSF